MSTPIPAPRNIHNTEGKRPIPAPRNLIPIRPERKRAQKNITANTTDCARDENKNESVHDETSESVNSDGNCNTKSETGSVKSDTSSIKSDVNSNTFTRRVRTLSNASKQIAGDIGGKVQEGKKAVIEGTRSSVRKITKRFHSVTDDQTDEEQSKKDVVESDIPVNIFSSIKFNSPIALSQDHVYVNVNSDLSIIEDDYNTPPPPYPPPPLREETLYDEPQSITSGSTNSSGSGNVVIRYPNDYESVFPAYPYSSDSESCVDMTAGTIDKNVQLNRSESWKFYDQVPKVEQIYNNVDSTPALQPLLSESATTESVAAQSVDWDTIDGSFEFIRQNSLYENFEIEVRPKDGPDVTKKPTESLMLQFDPLTMRSEKSGVHNESPVSVEPVPSDTSNVQELLQLEQMLEGDLYSNISNVSSADNWSISNESECDEYINPPTPPTRYDSLPEDQPTPPARENRDSTKSQWYTSNSINKPDNKNNANVKTGSSNSGLNLFKQMNVVLKKVPQFVNINKSKENFLQRPALMATGISHHKGMLYKVTNGPVEDLFGEFNARWCTLEGQSFLCHLDNTCNTIKENFPLDSILSIQILEDPKYKYKYENDDIHCFELNTSGKSRGGHIYGSRNIAERRVWMQKLAESLTNRFGPKLTTEYRRMGWAYIREGVSGEWVGAWLILSKRSLVYATDNNPVKKMDLRKARCIITQQLTENDNSPKTTDRGPNLLVDFPNGALYIRMWTSRETKVWSHIIKLRAHENGAKLQQQQLTKNDIPVIIEKCINFIYVYGSMSEGIYRRAGSSANVNDILMQFREDAWSVQLTMDKYSEHDVATALKRFFRDLPEPLLSNKQYFHEVASQKNKNKEAERVRMYKAAIDQLDPIIYNTIRKLIGHLHFITTQCQKNLMNLKNLSAVWGPTIMQNGTNSNPHQDTAVVADLIALYNYIFPENQSQIEQEQLMLQVLQKYSNSPHGKINNCKTSGDFRVWIYISSKKGETYNIAISPQRTAYEVCSELSSKINLPVDKIILEEIVLNESLIRPIHHTEKVLDVVLKWGYWDEADRKDNCLVLSSIEKYRMYIPENVLPVSGELKFADSKSKNFRSFMFEFSQAKLTYYKDKSCLHAVDSWNIEDIIWYLGNEPRRNPPSKQTLTFIRKTDKPNRSKASPWFGNVLAWNDEAFKITWIGTMWKSTYPQNFLPPVQHINILNA